MEKFSLVGCPIEKGTTLIEASAGTGKTYSIATLIVRLIGEHGLRVEEVLVVTFTKAATAELTHRIRSRVNEALVILRPVSDDKPHDENLELDSLLLELLTPVLANNQRHRQWQINLEQALESFDTASIHTIHGFCQRVLSQYAFESGIEAGLEVSGDHDALIQELVDDYFSNLYHDIDEQGYIALHDGCGLTRDTLLRLARKVAQNKTLSLIPKSQGGSLESWASTMARVRSSWQEEKEGILAALAELTHGAKDKKNVLAANAYKPEYTTKYAALFECWTTQATPCTALIQESWFRYFSLSYMEAKAKKAKGHHVQELLAHFQLPKILQHVSEEADALVDAHRFQFANFIRDEVSRRAHAQGHQSYDDLLSHVAHALEEPESPLRQAVANHYKAALIDEFQDTDEMQWGIFRRLFAGGHHYLYLIGDPKQAIYGFRGADVRVSINARRTAQRHYTMDCNFRSDAAYVDAMNHLLDWRGIFGSQAIDYVAMRAKKREVTRRLRFDDDQQTAPLCVSLLTHAMLPPDANRDTSKPMGRAELVGALPKVVASDIVACLRRNPEIYDETSHEWRPAHPGDLAVLVRSNKQASAMLEALHHVDLPAVVSRVGDVFQTEEAEALSWWLSAIARPHSEVRAKRLVTSLLFDWTAQELTTVDPNQWEEWIGLLCLWQKEFSSQGFMRTFRKLLNSPWGSHPGALQTIPTRILSQIGGERRLTNLYHLAELLHEAATHGRLGLEGLLSWLDQRRVDEHADIEALEMRLETDASAVQIVTMHKSKGLQYPFVWAPYLWDGNLFMPGEKSTLVAPDTDCPDGEKRVLNVQRGTHSEPKKSQIAMVQNERIREGLRLLYVTLTRAELSCKVYWARTTRNPETNALGSVLFGAPPYSHDPETLADDRSQWIDRVATAEAFIKNKKSEFWPHLEQLESTSGGTVGVEIASAPLIEQAAGRDEDLTALNVAEFSRSGVDRVWTQTSYSGLIRAKKHLRPTKAEAVDAESVGADYDAGTKTGATSQKTPDKPRLVPVDDAGADVPLCDTGGGSRYGEFFHKIYELIDFQWAHPERDSAASTQSVDGVIQRSLQLHGISPDRWNDNLTNSLADTLRTPLGGPLGAYRLCDLPKTRRLDELRFDFPVAGGHLWLHPGYQIPLSLADITCALALRFKEGADNDVMRKSYACRDSEVFLGRQKFAGFLTGFIDLVFKAPTPHGEKWFIADYKSNRIDPYRTRRYPISHFSHEYMRHEMEQHHYYLQYHIYTLALHRYLAHRLPNYSYESDFGGAYYLFIRGMVGPGTPGASSAQDGGRVNGVFFDKPCSETIEKLDELFNPESQIEKAAS